MDLESKDGETEKPEAIAPRNKNGSSALRKHQRWESHRQEIYQLYMVENNTLKKTMKTMKDKYGFRPSERKYKEKLKIWKFDKYLSGAEMKFIVSKDESRELEGKATAFYSHGIEINSRRIHSFKKRAKQQADAIETSRSPSADAVTPQGITYHTPLPDGSLQPHPANEVDAGSIPPSDLIPLSVSEDGNNPFSAEQTMEQETSPHLQSLDLTLPPTLFMGSTKDFLPQSLHEEVFHGLDLHSPFRIESGDGRGSAMNTSAEEMKRLAEGHKRGGDLAEAASEYLQLVDMMAQERGSDSKEVFEALSQLADIYQAQNKLAESIETYRKVLVGYHGIFGPLALETARIVHSLGKVLEENNELDEAEYCYRKAITALEKLEASGLHDRLDCQSFLGDLLSDVERYEEGLEMLIPLVASYKELGLTHRVISVLGSILEIYISLESWRKMDDILQEMRLLIFGSNGDVDIDYRKFPEFLLEGIHLGSVACQLVDYKLARYSMSRVIPKLELLDDTKYEVEKIYGYMEYGNCHLRYLNLEEAKLYLDLAKDGLNKLNRHDDPVATFVDDRLLELELWSGTCSLPNITELSMGSLRKLIGVHTLPLETDGEVICEGSRILGEDATDAGASSCKYGVTFSMTDITGVSISGHLPT